VTLIDQFADQLLVPLDNVIRKYTSNLRLHSQALGLTDNSGVGDVSRQLLLQLSSSKLELQATREFIKSAVLQLQTTPELIERLIPDTDNGNKLTMTLFHCTVSEIPKKIKTGTLLPLEAVETKLDQEPAAQDTASRSTLR
jgi:hypothetical protein